MKTKLIYTFLAVCCLGLLAQPCDVYVAGKPAKVNPSECNKSSEWDVSLSGSLGFFSFD